MCSIIATNDDNHTKHLNSKDNLQSGVESIVIWLHNGTLRLDVDATSTCWVVHEYADSRAFK